MPKHYYRALFQYDGTDYFGFQWQKGLPTIQNDINEGFLQLLGGKVSTVGASRTDTGVHAFEQIVKITTETAIDRKDFLLELNNALSPQIRCLDLSPCRGTFNPIVEAREKEYRYFFTNKLSSNSTAERFLANNPYSLNIELMQKSAAMIPGIRSFHNFLSAGSNVKTTEREIMACDLTLVDPQVIFSGSLFQVPRDLRECYQFRIAGNGFLKQMVRHLMRALWLVGGGKISPDEFMAYFEAPVKTKRTWKVAPGRGLYLYRIR